MRTLKAVAVLTASALLVTGCSLLSGGDDPEPTGGGDGTGGGGSTSEEPSGPDAQDLSAQIFDEAEATLDAEPIGTGTGTSPVDDVEFTIDVLSVRRVENGTVVLMRWEGPAGEDLDLNVFRDDDRGKEGNEAVTLYMVDPTVSRSRYLPLQFEDEHANNCQCPRMPLAFGEPQLLSATYAPLPEGATTVDLVVNDGFITITGLPVSG